MINKLACTLGDLCNITIFYSMNVAIYKPVFTL